MWRGVLYSQQKKQFIQCVQWIMFWRWISKVESLFDLLWLMVFRGMKQLKQGTSARKGRLMHLNSTLRSWFCCLEFFVWARSQMFTKNVFAFIFNKIPITIYWSLWKSVVWTVKGEFFCGLWTLREWALSVISSTEMSISEELYHGRMDPVCMSQSMLFGSYHKGQVVSAFPWVDFAAELFILGYFVIFPG